MVYPFPFVPGNILTAAELNALETATAPPSLGFTSGEYYSNSRSAASASVPTNQLCRFSSLFIPSAHAFDRIAIYSSGGAGTNNIRMGVYNNDRATGQPSTVLLDAGTVAVSAVGVFQITISQTLAAGWYWVAFCPQGGGGTRTFLSADAFFGTQPYQQNAIFNAQNKGYTEAGVAGAFATAVPVATSNIMPMPALRAT
jgi:hypothetical protein